MICTELHNNNILLCFVLQINDLAGWYGVLSQNIVITSA